MGISRPASAKWKEKLLSKLSIFWMANFDLSISPINKDDEGAVLKEIWLLLKFNNSPQGLLSVFSYSIKRFSVSISCSPSGFKSVSIDSPPVRPWEATESSLTLVLTLQAPERFPLNLWFFLLKIWISSISSLTTLRSYKFISRPY